MSDFIAEMNRNNPEQGVTEETAVRIDITEEEIHYLDFVIEYMEAWNDKTKEEHYINTATTYNTSQVSDVLNNLDVTLLNKYIDDYAKTLTPEQLVDWENDDVYRKFHIITVVFSKLVQFVELYMQMKGLSSKIHIYVACALYNLSLPEIATITGDDRFKQFYDDHNKQLLTEWRKSRSDLTDDTTAQFVGQM